MIYSLIINLTLLSQSGTSYNRGLLTKELETSYKDDTPTNYDHIKFNVKVSMSCYRLNIMINEPIVIPYSSSKFPQWNKN